MRVFVAIEISDQNVIESIKEFQSKIKIKAKPVSIENLHFTLQFLGEISEDMVEKIRNALKSIKFSSFKIKFKGVGGFPNIKNPRVIWIGTDDVGGNLLKNLANKVQDVLLPLGFTSDKSFKSHVTVFRIKNKIEKASSELKKLEEIEFGSQIINKIKLKQSILTTQGPLYSDLEVINAE